MRAIWLIPNRRVLVETDLAAPEFFARLQRACASDTNSRPFSRLKFEATISEPMFSFTIHQDPLSRIRMWPIGFGIFNPRGNKIEIEFRGPAPLITLLVQAVWAPWIAYVAAPIFGEVIAGRLPFGLLLLYVPLFFGLSLLPLINAHTWFWKGLPHAELFIRAVARTGSAAQTAHNSM